MIAKGAKGTEFDEAVVVFDTNGKELTRNCRRCQRPDPRQKTQFNLYHGPEKCPLVDPAPRSAPQDMDVDAAAAGDSEGPVAVSCLLQQ